MKTFLCFVIFAGLVFPVFSQASDTERFKTLGDTIQRSITRSTDTLANFDSRSTDDGNLRMFSSYRKRHDDLVKALKESEVKMERLFRTNDRVVFIKAERDNYERLLDELQSMKSDYDVWLRTVQ